MKAVIVILFGILLVVTGAFCFHLGRETKKPQLQSVHIQTRITGTAKIMGRPGPIDLEGELTITPEFRSDGE